MATTPDVRVKLSAEGVQEVVNALKSVQAQAQSTAKSATTISGGFNQLTTSVVGLKGAVAALAGAAVVVKAAEFAKNAMADAAALDTLSGVTGQTVEELSRLNAAATQAGVPLDELGDALKDFAERTAEAAGGGGEAVDALKAMGLSATDAQGKLKPQAQMLREVSDRFATYKDGAAKTTLAIKLFGDAGVKLLPVLSKGSEGLRQIGVEADEAGTTISTETAKQVGEFKKTIVDLTTAAQGFVREFGTPVLTAINNFIERIREAHKVGGSLVGTIGSLVNMTGYRTSIEAAEADVARLEQAMTSSKTVAGQWWTALTQGGNLELARKNLARLREMQAKAAVPPKAAPVQTDAPVIKPGGADGSDTAKAAALALLKANTDAAKAAVQQELARAKADAALKRAAAQDEYDQHLIDLSAYHRQRLDLIYAENAAELKATEEALAAAEALPAKDKAEEKRRQMAIEAATAEIDQRKIEGQLRINALTAAHRDELRALNAERTAYDRQQLERTGQLHKAATDALRDEVEALDELLKKQGVVGDERLRLLNELRDQGGGRNDFAESQRRSSDVNFEFDKRSSAIARELAEGRLWSFEAEERQLKVEQDRIVALGAVADELHRAAQASGDPELVRQAAQFSEQLKDLRSAMQGSQELSFRFRRAVEDNLSPALEELFDNIATGSMSIKDAVRSFAGSVVESLRKEAQKVLVENTIKPLLTLLGGSQTNFGGAVNQFERGTTRLDQAVDKFAEAVSKMAVNDQLPLKDMSETLAQALISKQTRAFASTALAGMDVPKMPTGADIGSFFSKISLSDGYSPYGAHSAAPWAKMSTQMNTASENFSRAVTKYDEVTGALGEGVMGLLGGANNLLKSGQLGGGGSVAGWGLEWAGGKVKNYLQNTWAAFADGGPVRGPGTGRSDSIPAWLSNGEFVMPAAAVAAPGAMAHLEEMRRTRRVPRVPMHDFSGMARFADGGLVNSLGQLRGGGGSHSMSSRLDIGLDPGLVIKTLESSAGQTAVIKALGNKRRAARAVGF